ncbi:MAG: S46 family peptidase [Bacteroidales bacterium]|nr:S46 family peptidase [Bacteroidales bacterium]
MKNAVLVLLMIMMSNVTRADEGMWLLSLLEGYTIEDMQSKGFKLTAEDIYSVNQACLKDAVVIFGGGCTGELISDEGLLLTNHHCGYGAIQRHSTVDNDYLTDGFWAMSLEEELPNENLSVRFLRSMEDVTEAVLKGTGQLETQKSDSVISANIGQIIGNANEEGAFESMVRPMFYGNQYFLFVYERFNDVRLVGAPPSSIGNFGEDNDNWMWPRHTGDFSVFRVYANGDNEPASYSPDNVPYRPRKFFEISMNGIEKGDFTMILGYPGSTQQFLHSDALNIFAGVVMPMNVEIRTRRMEVMDKYMQQSDEVRIQYSSKYRGVTNAWKKWQGAIKGLERLNAIEVKEDFEARFAEWTQENNERREVYGGLLKRFEEIYKEMEDYNVASNLLRETAFALELPRIASSVAYMMNDTLNAEVIISRMKGFYKDFYAPLDQEMFAVMMEQYREKSNQQFHPGFFTEVNAKYKGDFAAYAEKIYKKTSLSSMEALSGLLETYNSNQKKALKKLEKDPLIMVYNQFLEIYRKQVNPQVSYYNSQLNGLYKLWVTGQFEMQPEVRHYPDANFTMRLTYGEVEGYQPEDAVKYEYYTTLSGIIEKSKEGKHDYVIPGKLEELYNAGDYGDYGVNGTMPVCFTASNHTSGGNSGSPVIDAEGRLIGINFDRNWHGTMSDEMYDPDMCRNIAVDIRYVLFIIDKYAGAGYLLDEMVLADE